MYPHGVIDSELNRLGGTAYFIRAVPTPDRAKVRTASLGRMTCNRLGSSTRLYGSPTCIAGPPAGMQSILRIEMTAEIIFAAAACCYALTHVTCAGNMD